ncbi:MAG: hypothetical protein DSZ21_01595 [Tenericutes bacterium]|nr:MAG: hypothetical protein DSZ21_01595 [Mycoplasmatota bacterium]
MYGIPIDLPSNNRSNPKTICGIEIITAIRVVEAIAESPVIFLPKNTPSGTPTTNVISRDNIPTDEEVRNLSQTKLLISTDGNIDSDTPKSPTNRFLMYRTHLLIAGSFK